MGLSAGRPGPRWAAFAVVCFMIGVAFLFLAPAPAARAQPDQPGEAEAAPAATEAPAVRQNLFKHMAVSAGPFFGGLLLIVSIGLVALVVLLAQDLRMHVAVPPAFVEEFTD